MTRDQEIAWAAGLFEGEGTLGSFPHGWALAVQMTDEDVIRRFAEFVGVGHVGGPYGPYPGRGKVCWTWHTSRREHVLSFCALFGPLMGERRAARMAACIREFSSV
jgi:hypothetical protein